MSEREWVKVSSASPIFLSRGNYRREWYKLFVCVPNYFYFSLPLFARWPSLSASHFLSPFICIIWSSASQYPPPHFFFIFFYVRVYVWLKSGHIGSGHNNTGFPSSWVTSEEGHQKWMRSGHVNSGLHLSGQTQIRSSQDRSLLSRITRDLNYNVVKTGEVIRLRRVDISIKWAGLRYFSSS